MRAGQGQSLTLKEVLRGCASCLGLFLAAAGAIVAMVSLIFAIYYTTTAIPMLDLVRFRMLGAPPLRLTGEFSAGAVVIPLDVNPSRLQGPEQDPITWADKWPRAVMGPYGGTLRLDITSLARDEWVTIEKTMLFKILDYQPLHEWINVLVGEMGGGGRYRMFEVTLTPPQSADDIFHAHFSPYGVGSPGESPVTDFASIFGKSAPDYFTFSPGEQETFLCDVLFKEPGRYTLAIGVEYTYMGQRKTTWLERSFTIYVPSKWHEWLGSSLVAECQLLEVVGEEAVWEYDIHCESITE